ncbi:MAG: ribonuclease H-like domain-containing protein [Candidatus Krumholzibacteria bacterium]|nr:ribonuclease H-like domain-containing protein [Candidatus Krumholzibacteria bacterium]MDP6668393.1 ribonuclease H-like domain-containing protein [Candidatus Krumholzibacteria bacterium]MDP6797441.1 ribonuclease H-like domain-containing protein [Candidatus Krumholzibacteria bacterium]MDP7022154.1 ribonuclease H-like domain-containing protein [Candidatus Krumholzibacteria bacterium]
MFINPDRDLRDILEHLQGLRRDHHENRPAKKPRRIQLPEDSLPSRVGARVRVNGRGRYLARKLSVEKHLPRTKGLAAALISALPEMASLAGLTRDAECLAAAEPEDLLFLDLETTGLHRGIIVLLGYMHIGPGEKPLQVRQCFARNFDEEAPFLEDFLKVLRRRPLMVSFNGRSFDAPFLESRLRFHGFLEPLDYRHVDLLYLARRLWGHALPDCKLQTLERRLLGRRRLNDLPGREVPRVWEDYLHTRRSEELAGVWEHNFCDLATLAELLVYATRESVEF